MKTLLYYPGVITCKHQLHKLSSPNRSKCPPQLLWSLEFQMCYIAYPTLCALQDSVSN